jgi:hypothetical protein
MTFPIVDHSSGLRHSIWVWRACPQIDANHLLYDGNNEDNSRPVHLPEAPQHEHDDSLVFAQNADDPQ